MSRVAVEKVVKPPRTPVPRNGRVSGWTARRSVISTMRTPMAAQPMTLIQKVVHGNVPGAVGQIRVAP